MKWPHASRVFRMALLRAVFLQHYKEDPDKPHPHVRRTRDLTLKVMRQHECKFADESQTLAYRKQSGHIARHSESLVGEINF